MNSGFPPEPVYPLAIDSDYTLLLVHNTTEAILTANNEAWAEEIEIKPVAAGKPEIWADNGFANINGEMFYYDSVEKNSNDKVYKLTRCARSLGGSPSRFNSIGAVVRGFVVAEHHNMMVDALVKTEQFIGASFTPNKETLDWRIRNLREIPIIFDDFGCPDVNFTFRIISDDPSEGTLASYKIQVTGNYTSFNLSFGDGTSTNSIADGEHRYAPNGNIDPVVTFTNTQCTVVQTPIERTNSDQPTPAIIEQSFLIPVLPDFSVANLTVTPFEAPEVDITLPPNLFPCIDLGPLGLSPINIPSIIIVEPPINIPSIIEIGDIDIPSLGFNISFPDIEVELPSFGIGVSFPSFTIGISVPSDIAIDVNVNISVPEIPNIGVDVPEFPNIQFDPVTFPDVAFDPVIFPNVAFDPVTFPTVTFGPIDIPSTIFFDESGVPDTIYFGPVDIPSTITLVNTLPNYIEVFCCSMPSLIFVLDDIPEVINVVAPPIEVVFGAVPEIPDIGVDFGDVPEVTVNWGNPPTINVAITCPSSTSGSSMTGFQNLASKRLNTFDDFNVNDSGVQNDIEVAYDITGFPSEIKLVAHDIVVKHDLPLEIVVKAPEIPEIRWGTPPEIRIRTPEEPLFIETKGIPDVLKLIVDESFPKEIRIASPISMPMIKIDASDIPTTIKVDMPETIRIEPTTIKLEVPEFIPISYVGEPISVAPISVAIQLDIKKLLDENPEDFPCVALVPCRAK